MKIQNDLLTSVLGGVEQTQKTPQNEGIQSDFADILADELADGSAAGGNLGLGASKLSLMPPLAEASKTGQAKPLTPEQKKIVDGISAALDMLDEYTGMIAEQGNGSSSDGNSGNMKKAYSLLDAITSSSSNLNGALANISKNPETAGILNNPAIGDMVNELRVLATTEKFKMNRGDYFS